MKPEMQQGPRIPVSTYRLQFGGGFGFSAAKRIIPYLHELGISDIYSSPYLKARAGSPHGYDITDHNALNPEAGGQEEYDAMADELRRHGMGQVLDIVPNHMGIGKENAWWMDVLENGPSSVYAKFFDVDWEPVKSELKDKLLLPVLGEQYGEALEDGEISIAFEEGAFFASYYQHKLPLRPQTYMRLLGHGLEELKESLPADDPYLIELLSIATALNNLPPYTEKEPEKVGERAREKEVIKKRLFTLYGESPQVRAFIDNSVTAFNGEKGKPRSFDLIDDLLREQAYRLAYWRVAVEEINYRRFFDINELAGIRAEDPDVFRETHKLIFRLVGEGKVTGLRVDHPDGLYNPLEYFRRLQTGCFGELLHGRPETSKGLRETDVFPEITALSKSPDFKPFYIVGEKILMKDERMPEDWPIFSTTGYVFMNAVNGVFVDAARARAFDEIYNKFTRKTTNFPNIVYESRKLIMLVAMASEVNTLGHYLNRISEKNRHTRDFTLRSLINAIIEVIAFFPVYRTYITAEGITERDRRYIESAVGKAKRNNLAISASVFDFLKDVLLLNYHEGFDEEEKGQWLDFTMRFQQLTGPVLAKGVEDTAFYIYNRLVSLNEVGGSPDRFGVSLEAFHGKNIERAKFWPHALITTSTHDSKRGEDVRARVNVLSELPGEWRECLARWSRLNRKKKPVIEGIPVPDRNEEYLLYQTLIGAWPSGEPGESFKKRIMDYMLKAAREAKVNTSWLNPNTVYEDAIMIFIDKALADGRFLQDFLAFQRKVSHIGMFNSLSQTLLKITSPGVPDFYQGTELWDLSLVDPDNRRPVDYETRIKSLDALKGRQAETPLAVLARELTAGKADGMVKLYLTWKALNFRAANRGLFEYGEYISVEAVGQRAENVCTFMRRNKGEAALTVAPRLLASLIKPDEEPLGDGVWGSSFLALPFEEPGARYMNVFTGEVLQCTGAETTALYLKDILKNFPVALLERRYD